ncbi:fatty acid kinase binding subunit FakB2 [Staphylococcus sp. NRL 16/872]|uniref:fatty acid kinase binding subunit FakB2 n=1 Tax=Staphylococcus sp. NRL 16/872 TaxID=2930131 RepID=UPI001FB4F329|nr:MULTISPECIES: fatty acid kinase binding subunit FakB2 [unclassified Staphylococcus]MCJ1656368.1 fatty acid kinase binding subunit FakB2 [Staphylococcus sp. NRL 21/187]MCJ1662130.1 fatty acid kinase binding subunit FakB2 [Staphylococcus sp. NRL 18/288]MCJ1668197.1 fatty acid kinase binding subunit FakB2 [Staphylococcus sp. NRL 19/737]WEN68397.1 fatty acid kinase binding subunit FakB2 [Staphylococcus sp. NRL 16/872]
MTKQIIVTDSTSDLSQDFLKQQNIHVIPLSITIDGKSYVDQLDITSEEFIQRIEEDADVKTSQPPIGKFIELYETLGKDNVEIFSIHMSSGLSGTYQTALQASEMVDANVTVIDSKSISFGLGYQIQKLVELINTNLTSSEIVESLKEVQKNTKLFVVIGQLNQLIKGGRISKTKGFIGNIMKIKPIGTLENGYLEMVHNARTQNSSIQYLKKEISEFIDKHKIKSIGVAHANVIDFVEKLKSQFDDAFGPQEYDVNVTTPVISTHTGQGAIGLVVVRH